MEEMLTWAAQTAVVVGMGLIAWMGKRILAEQDKKIEGADKRFQEMIGSIRSEMDTRSDMNERRFQSLQDRLGSVEQREAADQALLEQMASGINAITSRMDSLYKFLTEKRG